MSKKCFVCLQPIIHGDGPVVRDAETRRLIHKRCSVDLFANMHWQTMAMPRFIIWYAFSSDAPDPQNLSKTHARVGSIRSPSALNAVYGMKGPDWQPEGAGHDLIESLGLTHTSFSLGDILISPTQNIYLLSLPDELVFLGKEMGQNEKYSYPS